MSQNMGNILLVVRIILAVLGGAFLLIITEDLLQGMMKYPDTGGGGIHEI